MKNKQNAYTNYFDKFYVSLWYAKYGLYLNKEKKSCPDMRCNEARHQSGALFLAVDCLRA